MNGCRSRGPSTPACCTKCSAACRRGYTSGAPRPPEAFGLSASTVSRRFKRAARKLRELTERRLETYDLVALLLDGKTFAEDEMVAAVGVTITGEKVLLGFVQTATENRKVCAAFLRELVERGLRVDLGVLVVTDGAKPVAEQRAKAAMVGDGLLEPRLRRIKNFRALPLLREALWRQINGAKKAVA